ncbi:MAG: AAA family ATPase, partial [Candidatus Aenigmatarchaeota archaeon]
MSEETMELNFREARQAAKPFLMTGKAVLLRGKHGIGKTSVIYQIGNDLGIPVVERRVSQMTPGDILGLPDRLKLVDVVRQFISSIKDFEEEMEQHAEDGELLTFLQTLAE